MRNHLYCRFAAYADFRFGSVERGLYLANWLFLLPFNRIVNHIKNVLVVNNNTFYNSFRHVQVNNDGAIGFYKKFGFKIVETKQHYYKRIEPADAHVLQKTLRGPTSASSSSLLNGIVPHAKTNGHDWNLPPTNPQRWTLMFVFINSDYDLHLDRLSINN